MHIHVKLCSWLENGVERLLLGYASLSSMFICIILPFFLLEIYFCIEVFVNCIYSFRAKSDNFVSQLASFLVANQ